MHFIRITAFIAVTVTAFACNAKYKTEKENVAVAQIADQGLQADNKVE